LELSALRQRLQAASDPPLAGRISAVRQVYVDELAGEVLLQSGAGWQGLSSRLGRITLHPVWGLCFLALVLYALYWFVGIFGAGTLVGFLENDLFAVHINPWATGWVWG
jgi:ferrous iron transport protein B